jgi:acid-sensing ion channel, other
MQYEMPRWTTGFYMVGLENSVTFIVDPKLMTISKDLQDYPVTERKCYFSDERRLNYFEQYTQSNCELECEANVVLEKCGCLLMFIEGKISLRVIQVYKSSLDSGTSNTCGSYEETCYFSTMMNLENSNHLGCECLPTCSSILFESEILANDINMTDLKGRKNINEKKSLFTFWPLELLRIFSTIPATSTVK